MKIDRLIGITMYLLNRDIVSARELAERFEVSTRTIARDMESLCLAGVPISSSTGASGGYEILDTFKLNKSITTVDDYLSIVTALKGLCSAYDNQKVNNALEKMLTIGFKDDNQRVFVDFGVVKEGENIPQYVRNIESAIHKNVLLTFDYTDGAGCQNRRTIEPIALNYRWYAWYLLGFCTCKNDYRFFKLNRITNLSVTDQLINHIHQDIPNLLEKQWKSDARNMFKVKLLCKADSKVQIVEYLKGKIIEEHENGDFIMELHAIENERMWFSLLLGFGDKVKVLEPQEIIDMICQKATEINNLY